MTYTRIKKINIYINEIKYKKIFILNIFKHCWWIEANKENKKTKQKKKTTTSLKSKILKKKLRLKKSENRRNVSFSFTVTRDE